MIARSNMGRNRAGSFCDTQAGWERPIPTKNVVGHSRTALVAGITILESILGKIFITCFVYALAQASPLLSELAKKVLP